MPAGPVNRALLESFYQNPGEIYDDAKTEGAFDVLADQVDDNWTSQSDLLTILQSTTPGNSGADYVKSAVIAGVTGTSVYEQLAYLESQIQAIIGASIPPGSISATQLQDGAVTNPKLASNAVSFAKLDASQRTASVGGRLYAYAACFGI